MNIWSWRRALTILLGAAVVAAMTPARPAAAGDPTPQLHRPSGLTLLPPIVADGKPLPEKLAVAWGEAWRMAEQNPDDLGYPWADRAGNRLVVSSATAKGGRMASAL